MKGFSQQQEEELHYKSRKKKFLVESNKNIDACHTLHQKRNLSSLTRERRKKNTEENK